jgi:hypothetical protein
MITEIHAIPLVNGHTFRSCVPNRARIFAAMNSEDAQTPPASYGTPQNPWRQPDGSVISCTEKLKVMQENLDELRQCAQAALEDAVLMGCDEAQVKEAFLAAIAALTSGYAPASSAEPVTETQG